jgi:phosphoglycerol transferase MdoB-like AlkP superfamily enzyme
LARILFYYFNSDALAVDSLGEFMRLSYYGLAFDTTAIFYINALFILCSILPFRVNNRPKYQRFLFYLYFATNLLTYATNFVDFIYYKYNFSRTTIAVLDVLQHESNANSMLLRFLFSYWHVTLLFFATAAAWVYLYKRINVSEEAFVGSKLNYYLSSIIAFFTIITLMIGGIRGDFKKSTRPINIIDANRHTNKVQHADIVLNTPFAIIRTFNATSFKKLNLVSNDRVNTEVRPFKQYQNNPQTRPNIVIFITESFGREYWGSFNRNTAIPNFVSYTPFLDSLSQESLIFTNAYCNGSKSIHGMSSVLAGIPSFKDAFTSSPYPKQKIQSLVSILKELGYDTSFFHGAANGSMGFLGFGNILGFDHYYGKTEYNNDADFDGAWGIWDEPFFQFMKQTLDKKQRPFLSTIFTVSSHEPYVVPEKYKNKFPKGTIPMHQCVGYTDFAFKKFFESAQKAPWFKNTIFIITADHTNQIAYKEYNKIVNRYAVPILIYKPDGSLKGVNTELAQQIDIYPTLIDMIGYQKPFRSWGRSLLGDTLTSPFVLNYNGKEYQFMKNNYICTFNGNSATGFYHIADKSLEKNLISNKNAEMNALEITTKAYLQDYFNRIIDKKLDEKK